MPSPLFRSLAFIFVFILVVALPWWLSAVLLAGLVIYIPFYLEVLFFGFMYDALYSANFHFPFPWLTSSTLFLLLTMFIKSQIRK